MSGRRDRPTRPPGVLAGMRIRKKLIVLHTTFSLVLAAILLVALRPALIDLVDRAELSKAGLALATGDDHPSVRIETGSASDLGLDPEIADEARESAAPVPARDAAGDPMLVVFDEAAGVFRSAHAVIPEARRGVVRLYIVLTIALLAIYGLVALALEVFVLPRHVYRPIRRMLDADHAVRDERHDEEIIPDREIPRDELGEIMRSRNETILALRSHEAALADAFDRIESVATDLKRKNHLLERARQNLASADRLASLGMMSAGIAHELNTPLSVLKGLVEEIAAAPNAGVEPERARLMSRVVGRLERLGESLLDFARVRPPSSRPASLREIAEEALTLVRLDRDASEIGLENEITNEFVIDCDADRMVQVLVNIARNSVDALGDRVGGRVTLGAERSVKEGSEWVSVTVTDNGPGLDPELLPTLFEPFVSTRLDARGTGLGLAVAEGIVHEHGGVILARNRPGRHGAVFEIVLPAHAPRTETLVEADHA